LENVGKCWENLEKVRKIQKIWDKLINIGKILVFYQVEKFVLSEGHDREVFLCFLLAKQKINKMVVIKLIGCNLF
jgi:hypothetical protein